MQAKREYENYFLGSPYRLSNYYSRYLLSEREWTMDELLAEVSCRFTFLASRTAPLTLICSCQGG